MNISTNLFDMGGLARENLASLSAADANRPPARRQGVSLSLDGLSKSFGERAVLHDIGLQLKPGEFVAVVGRSGCGKSTLLRAIAGLETVEQGTIAVGQGAIGTSIRIMFQEARLLPWKTVLENVALGLPRSLNAAAATLSTVGLGERANDWPAELSGGQRQRVALARALLHEPQLLLLDEPLGALDALTRIEMQQLIESLWLARGFTAVLVTHDVQEALALADRVVLIEEGRITLDLKVDLPRPRARGNAAFAALEQQLLESILHPAPSRPASKIAAAA
ncbi:ATP-binding cassette domain-containing protein [Duganella phyllosphaerae]|uniref:Aliphatic sulfonates import ATP-binding protein SsuB n=1 Tax=Duganella phyllosphaerae TaxID=762836 RepID=A0A1E7X536_9BURK|nr:ATP-binding cassette domain-containing protein [Duganella phyllosphaerae]OFA07698.1 aliphatic sulfonates import ATP-binding protein SsuB [Duganella phyllosphaerae]